MTTAASRFPAIPRDPASWARIVYCPVVAAAFAALIATGFFDGFRTWDAWRYAMIAILPALVLYEIIELSDRGDDQRQGLFKLSIWLMLSSRIAVQAAGAMDSPLYPVLYLLFAALTGLLGPVHAIMLWLLFVGLEASWMVSAGAPDWAALGGHGGYLAAFGVVVGAFIHLERRGRQKASRALDRISTEVGEFQRDDTVHRLSGLSEGGRRKEDLRSAFALDESFHRALESGRAMLGADALALYWRSSSGDYYHLREISGAGEEVDRDGEFVPAEGPLGLALERRRAVRVNGSNKLRGALPHYANGGRARSALVVPVIEDDKPVGLLVADRVAGEFGIEDEKLITALCRQVREVHSHALLVRRAQAQAERFKSLARLSHRLTRTLDLPDIFESVVRTGRAIAEPSSMAVVLQGRDTVPMVVAVDGELSDSALGAAVPLGDSLAGWAIERGESLSIADLAGRVKSKPALGPGLDPAKTRSLMVHPLPLPDSSIGAVVFMSREAEAFSGYVVRATEVLADVAAVAIHNAMLYREMEERATTDGLTGLINHRSFQDQLCADLERAGRLGGKLSIALLDIDHFKKVNDTYGHPVGDEVLKAVAGALKSSIRKVDTAARYGGEEFVLILMGTDVRGALELCERVRKKVKKLRFVSGGREFGVTMSLGASVYPDDGRKKERLIERADQALYRAKQSGRNRTVPWRALESPSPGKKHGDAETQRRRERKKK